MALQLTFDTCMKPLYYLLSRKTSAFITVLYSQHGMNTSMSMVYCQPYKNAILYSMCSMELYRHLLELFHANFRLLVISLLKLYSYIVRHHALSTI